MSVVFSLVLLWIIEECSGIKADEKLSCWTLNVTGNKTSYLYYYRGDPGEFVANLNARESTLRIDRVPFNSSAYVMGAVAADNNQPMSLFAHDKISGGIFRLADNLRSLQPVFTGSSVKVEDIAVDWVSQNVYYTDPLVGVGLVSYTKHFRIIIHKVAALHGIDIDPMLRMIFYADGDAGHIYQATLMGENHEVLTGAETTKPTALVVDAGSKVLYWLDEGTQYLQSWDYTRSVFRQIWNSYKVGVGVFTGIDIYQNYIFISLKNEQSMKIILTNGTEWSSFSVSNGTSSMSYGISISTPDRKPHIDSPCYMNNGGCEHICIHESNIARKCVCQFGYQPDGDRCVTAKDDMVTDNFLLFADSSSDILYQVDTKTEEFHTLYVSPSPSSSPGTVTYDPEEQIVYWTDKNKHKIWSMNLLKNSPTIFTDLGSSSVIHSLHVAGSIRFIYYTDTELRRIARINLDTKESKVIVQLKLDDKPTHLQLDTEQGYLYWINTGNPAKIERADMYYGTNKQVLVSSELKQPSGLALDLQDRFLYWVDEGFRKVERSNWDGSNRELFTITPAAFRGLTLDEHFLYMTGNRSLIKIEKKQRSIEQLGPEYFLLTSGVSCYSSSNSVRGISLIIIIGVAAGGVVLLAIIIAGVVVCAKHRRKRRTNNKVSKNEVSNDRETSRHSEGNKYEEVSIISLEEMSHNQNRVPDNLGVDVIPVLPPFRGNTQNMDNIHQYLTTQPINT